jgi:dienelactone hydrolase
VLASALAEQGYLVVVPKCPLDLELLCIDAAGESITDNLPWAVGGHSLGGVAAAQHLANGGEADGLVLWASYPLADLADRDDLAVASISGSEDGFSTPQDIADARDLLPAGTTATEIQGAIHAFFGDYGDQPGDGTPTISREDAQAQIIEATAELLAALSATG